jgi:lipopolysaccharide export system protein LptA
MRRSQAARYARWSAAVALLLACVTLGVFLKRGVQSHIERKQAPPAPPVNVEKQSSGLTFSKMDGPRRIFTVEASKSTDFKDRNASLLENVKVTIFGKAGDRHDIIHTQSCQYGKEKGAITCDGAVQMDLQSAADAERAAQDPAEPPQIVHVETTDITFDRASGDADTQQPVSFHFPSGRGDAVGAKYNSEQGTLLLLQNVRLDLSPPAPKSTAKKSSPAVGTRFNPGSVVRVQGSSLDFGRDSRILHISGPAEAESATAHLAAGELTLELDPQFRASRLLAWPFADGKAPELTSRGEIDKMDIVADQLTAEFDSAGWVARMQAKGNAHGSRQSKDEADEFRSDAAAADMWPAVNRMKELNLNGGVSVKTRMAKTGDARALHTGALRINFTQGTPTEHGKAALVETLTAGTMEWTDPPVHAGDAPTQTKLQADKLRLVFGDEGKPKQLTAAGNVETERTAAGAPLQTATAKSGVAQLLASGGWSQMNLQDDIHLRQGDRSARADHATFVRADQTALLTGRAVARDATTETHAPRILFYQSTGEIRAEGGVRSTDFSPSAKAAPSPGNNSAQPAQLPANITSDNLEANSKSGRALYTGHARLWQGGSVLEADSIELLRDTKILNAAGNVRAVFPQTSAPTPAGANANAPNQSSSWQAAAKPASTAPAAIPSQSQPPAAKTVLWHIASGTLTYNDITSTAHLEKNVTIQSPDQRIRAPQMDLYFTRGAHAAASASTSAANLVAPQQISRAIGTGGVIVDEGNRRATADRGEYTAADGKFIMIGGDPTLYDSTQGTTKGRQLTFFLADDTIIVDSENGSRTLTKHRVNH